MCKPIERSWWLVDMVDALWSKRNLISFTRKSHLIQNNNIGFNWKQWGWRRLHAKQFLFISSLWMGWFKCSKLEINQSRKKKIIKAVPGGVYIIFLVLPGFNPVQHSNGQFFKRKLPSGHGWLQMRCQTSGLSWELRIILSQSIPLFAINQVVSIP